MGGIAGARTNGLGFAGVTADSNETNPLEEMGAAARVEFVVVGIDEGKLPRIGTCAMANDVGGVPRPAAGIEVLCGMHCNIVACMTSNIIMIT